MSVVISLVSLLPLVTPHIHPHARSNKKSGTAEDIQSHLELELETFNFDSIKNMTEEERDYHYFRLHDFDKNDLLDGLEVLKAMSHSHAKNNKDEEDCVARTSCVACTILLRVSTKIDYHIGCGLLDFFIYTPDGAMCD